MPPLVVVGVVLFGTKFLRESLPSLIAQSYKNVIFLLRDHSPSGAATEFVRHELPAVAARVKIEVGENVWHSGGQNLLIRRAIEMNAEFYICASSDALYPPNLIEKVITELSKSENQKFGSVAVKLKKWDAAKNAKTEILDSCGLGITRAHQFFDRGQNQLDRGQLDRDREVFGASGALAILRQKALTDIETNGEFFDERLHWKNDVDLAYRLQWAGWRTLFLPKIVVWHARGLGSGKSRRRRSNFEKENSTFGQLVAVEKNWSNEFSLRVKILTKIRLFALHVFAIFFERATLAGFRQFRKIRGNLQPSQKLVQASEIEKLMTRRR